MEDSDTDTLRKLAPCWTLAGDERLLTILQNTHQRLVSKCQEANSQLEQMATALDDANISLQNVNNQFMALSSSQFVERRVYDDDVDVAAEPPAVKESPKPSAPDELSILKRSIAVIEKTHEVITILQDSDTESDTDDELPDRLVMKPKDMYADRPLPYIIGSEPWKNKWHAGLMPEDSDTDSSTSKVDRESEQYSQSEPEDFELSGSRAQDIPAPPRARQISETSSELPSEPTPNTKPTPSDVASEIARRLGGGDLPPRVVEQEPQYEEPSKPIVRKVYKPQEPVASTIFPDEPPPLDEQSDSDTDIFADLHRKQPYNEPRPRQYVSEDLFGVNEAETDEGGDIFNDFANQPTTGKPVSLFEAGPTPHMFDKQRVVEEPELGRTAPRSTENTVEQTVAHTAGTEDVKSVKKPVGGISLFGSKKGAENIGAAILQRNRRKSYSSSEESGNETTSHVTPIKQQQAKKEKDIFDDLFAKSEAKKVAPKPSNAVKDKKHEIPKPKEEISKKDVPKPIDLFSDNLFDDIDDIFTTNVVKASKNKQKSIFEDDDDLFSEVAETKPVEQKPKNTYDNKKGLFDSDDDLFADNLPKDKPVIGNKPQSAAETSSSTIEVGERPNTINDTPPKSNEKPAISAVLPNVAKEKASLFEDEDDSDDIFSNIKSNKDNSKVSNSTGTDNMTKNTDAPKNVFKSPSLFDEDDDESDLFTDSNKSQKNTYKSATTNPKKIENKLFNEISNKAETNNEVEVLEKDISAVGNKVLNVTTSKTNNEFTESKPTNSVDVNIRKGTVNNNNFIKTAPVKTDVFEESKTNNILFGEDITEASNTIENYSNDCIPNIDSSLDNTNYESTTKHFNKDDSVNNLNINTKTTQIERLDDSIASNDYVKEPFSGECKPETNQELPRNNTTVIINNDSDNECNIKESFRNEEEINDDLLEENNFSSPKNVSSFEESNIKKIEIPKDVNKTPNPDIFSDIISEPPDFEKPKEPKKSKNVNALFDDDSDDETLFFKRDDVITDEKPDDFTAKQDRLFDMFTNEPPDEDLNKIDDDLFSQLPMPKLPGEETREPSIHTNIRDNKSIPNNVPKVVAEIASPELEIETKSAAASVSNLKENTNDVIVNNGVISSESLTKTSRVFNDNIFKQPTSLISNVLEKRLSVDDDDDELFKSLPAQLPGPNTKSISRYDEKSDELFTSLPPNLDRETASETCKPTLNFKLPPEFPDSKSRSEVKKVGKLKVGININVNALLPGASPKKVKPVDNIDGQGQSQVEVQNEVTPSAEPVSFAGEPESKILDNKLSKERPRIQVKRRPSTRKARKEAVRKSGIDFGDDSTDNSSSIDDPPKTLDQPDLKITDNGNNKEVEQPTNENAAREETSKELDKPVSEDLNAEEEKPVHKSVEPEIKTDLLETQINIDPGRLPVKSDSTTKIVYILNDEDIFNTSAIEDPITKTDISTNQVKEIPKSTEYQTSNVLENNHLNSNINTETGIKTLGKTYQATNNDGKKKSKSLFGEDEDSDDEEIFRNKKTTVKTNIFDSDSEGDLFGNTKKTDSGKNVDKVVKDVKGPLFGDDDDDDLFGVKTSKRVDPQQPSKSSAIKETPAATEPVFEDPLSMFGDED